MRRFAAVAFLMCLAAGAGEPVATLHAEDGWYEEAFALDDAGGRLALVHTSGEGKSTLEVRDLGQQASMGSAPFDGTPPVALELTRNGVLVFTRGDAGVEARLVGAGEARRFGPAADIARSERGGRELLAVHTVKGTTHQVVIHDLAKPKPIATRSFTVDASGNIASLDLTLRHWRRGFTQIGGRRPGRYDKKLDRRLNDADAVYDLVDGKFVMDAPAADLMLQAKVGRARDAHPGLDAFVFFDGEQLARVGSDDALSVVDLPTGIYDRDSLAQSARGDEIVFSLAVDPLNPDAVARKKRDAEVIDFFRLSTGSPPQKVATVPRDGREIVWRTGGSRLAVLRKHKAFGRGGPDLEVYDLAR